MGAHLKIVDNCYNVRIFENPLKRVLGVRISAHFTVLGLCSAVMAIAKANVSQGNTLTSRLYNARTHNNFPYNYKVEV